jgi:hypothetical protein
VSKHRAVEWVRPSLDRARSPVGRLIMLEALATLLVGTVIWAAVVVARHPSPSATGGRGPVATGGPTYVPDQPIDVPSSPSPSPSPAPPSPSASPAPVVVVTHTSTKVVPSAVPACLRATFVTNTRWPGGIQAQFTIRNCGALASNGWAVTLSVTGSPQIQAWDADAASGRGSVVFVPKDYNRVIQPGASVTFGFNALSSPYQPATHLGGCTVTEGTCAAA